MKIGILACAFLLSACTTTGVRRRPSAQEESKQVSNLERLRVLLMSAQSKNCDITVESSNVNFGDSFANAPVYPTLNITVKLKKGGERSMTVYGEPEMNYITYKTDVSGRGFQDIYVENFTAKILEGNFVSLPELLSVAQVRQGKGGPAYTMALTHTSVQSNLDGKGPSYRKPQTLCDFE